MNKEVQLPPAISQPRLVVLLSYYGLIAYFLLASVMAIGISITTIVVWFIQILPLLLFHAGLSKTHLRSYGWMSFVILLYFTHGILLAFDPERRWLGITETSLCVVMFCGLIVFIRRYRDHFQTNF